MIVIPNFLKKNISLWTFVQFRVERYFQEIQILVSFRWLSLQQSSSHQTPNFKQKNTTFTSSECSQRKKKLLQKTEIRERSFKVPKVFERLRSIVALERCSAPWTRDQRRPFHDSRVPGFPRAAIEANRSSFVSDTMASSLLPGGFYSRAEARAKDSSSPQKNGMATSPRMARFPSRPPPLVSRPRDLNRQAL